MKKIVYIILVINCLCGCGSSSDNKIKVEEDEINAQSDSNGVSMAIDTVVIEKDSLSEKYIFIDDWRSYKTIYELIKYEDFKDIVLYIDLWGVVCGPCIREFQFVKELKERYKDKSVKFLYIADGPQDSCYVERWKGLIYKYELSGYHLPWSRVMSNSIQALPDYKGTMSPHYLLVNKKGEIIPNAPRPITGETLYKQIDALLQLPQ